MRPASGGIFMPEDILKPAWRRVLIVGSTSDERIRQAALELKKALPGARISCLKPSGRPPGETLNCDETLKAQGEDISPADFKDLPEFDAVVLAMGYVGRPSYPALCRGCLSISRNCFLYSPFGLQPMDEREAAEAWPGTLGGGPSGRRREEARAWIFFRPSDQTAHRMAERLESEGAIVWKVETLKAFEMLLPKAQAAFFDWCLVDYRPLFEALKLARDAGLWTEAFLALDLADVAEDNAQRDRIMALNRGALGVLNKGRYLFTRAHIAERYKAQLHDVEPITNLPDASIWKRCGGRRQAYACPAPRLRLSYHGLFYFWHEVQEFVPVYDALLERADVSWDLYGRIHETVKLGGIPLFPERERIVRESMETLKTRPGVKFHGFVPMEKMAEEVASADFYVGITKGSSLMARSEWRTGVEEAAAMGMRILHKRTEAMNLAERGAKLLEVDSASPDEAAAAILKEWGH